MVDVTRNGEPAPVVQLQVWLGARGGTDADDRRVLSAVVARAAGVPAAVVEQHCTRCGGPHGRPVPVSPAACTGWAASLSRAEESVAIAVAAGSPVGIDLESIARLRRHSVDAVAFSDSEIAGLGGLSPAAGARARAALWTAKEAVLKLTGQGLRVDPRELTVDLTRGGAPTRVRDWPGAPFALHRLRLFSVPAAPGLVATVAVLAESPPTLRLLRVERSGW
ncbi:MAG: 4'-phosphopantetheinyl transferase superfamily protein [Cryobacterium sp.]